MAAGGGEEGGGEGGGRVGEGGRECAEGGGGVGGGCGWVGAGVGGRCGGVRCVLWTASVGVRSIAVLGAGQMGNGIAQVAACAGYEVTMIDIEQSLVERGMAAIGGSLDKLVAKERMSREDADSALARVRTSTGKGAAAECDLVVEAIPEIPELKLSTFAELDGICKPEAILASNTSSISIDEIAAATSRPDRVIGMHFFNPVPLMSLLELVRHDTVSEETIAAAQSIGSAMGKTTIVVRDVPGFATSRLGVVLGNEAIRMLADGVASASDIDTAMRLGYRHPMGPLELSDLVGLDVRRDILNNLADAFGEESYRPHPMLNRLVETGDRGKKAGKGIYDWTSGKKVER